MSSINRPKDENPWIDAFSDPKADLQTFSTCLALSDLSADDDHKLVIGDFGSGIQSKLKVYKGTSLSAELPLLNQPTAVKCVHTDRNEPRVAGIIVATGANVLVYRNCRPYFKFSLPPQECSGLEVEIWNEISTTEQLVQVLKDLSMEMGFSNLSSPSQNLLLMSPAHREEYVNSKSHFVAKKQMVITCVTTLNKYANSERDVSVVLLATESAQLFIMDPETFTIINDFKLPDVCCNIYATGIYLVEYSVILAMRNGALYSLRINHLKFITQLMTHTVSLLMISHKIMTANMDSTMSCYNLKGRKYWTLSLPDNPLYMTGIQLPNLALHLTAVSFSRGNINLYNDSSLVYVLTTQEPIHSMIFGKYGQEEHALISIASSGTLDIKLLKRTAQFSNDYKETQKNYVKPHDIKFLVPKKSKLFLEQSLRERQKCKEIHTWFNYSWTNMKVQVSESYIDALHNANVVQNEALRIIVEVFGLGPRMKIRTVLQNMSQNIMPMNYKVTFIYDAKLYKIHQPVIKVPMMVHGIPYSLETLVTCHTAMAGVVQVVVVSTKVILSATVNMPDCRVLVIDNLLDYSQQYIKLPQSHKVVNIVTISPDRELIAVSEEANRPTISVYEIRTKIRLKLLGNPIQGCSGRSFTAIQFTHDSKYLVGVVGAPDWLLLYYNWEKGKVESTVKAIYQHNPTSISQISCHPTERTICVLVGTSLFRIMSCCDNVWRQYGFQRAENLPITGVCWITKDLVLAGTQDGRIIVVESADLRGVYKAYDLNEIYLKVKLKEADGRQIQVSLASNQVTEVEKSGIYEVRALTAFSDGFAYSCATGTVNVFQRTEVNKWVKKNVIDVRGPALGTMDLTRMDQVNYITISPAQKKMMVTTGRTDLYVGELFQEQNIEQEPLKKFTVLFNGFHQGQIGAISSCLWKPLFLTVGLQDRTCRIWDYKQKSVVLIKDFPDEIYSAAFHPSGFYCLLGFTDKLKLLMILIDDMKPIRHVDIKGCTLVEFSKGGHIFAAVNGVAVELYSSITFQNLAILTGHIGPVRAVQFVKEDGFLYTCGQEGSLYKWNIQTQKRIEDIFTEGCANYDVGAKTTGDMVYTVGTDGTLKEIMDGEIVKTVPMNQYALYAIVISHSDQLMFVGGEKGCVVSVVYPLVYPPAYKEYNMHTKPVTKIMITNDDDIVVSVSSEGALCIWEIKNAKGKKKDMLAGFSHLSEVILDIEEWTRRIEEIGELRTRMAEVEGEHSYVVRQVSAAHEATLKEVHGGYIQSIEDLKARIKQMEREHLLELHNYSTKMEELISSHGHELDTKERQYATKFIREYERYDGLVEDTKEKISKFKRKFRAFRRASKSVIDLIREENDTIIEIKSQKIKELENRIREMVAQSEQNKAHTEMECDIEIIEARNSFRMQLKEKDDEILNLNNANGLLVKRSKMLENTIEENKNEIDQLKERCEQLMNTIAVSSKEIEVLKREVDERDITIARKDELVVKVTKKNELCSKEKYVRDTQLECLKYQLQPKIEEIEKLRSTSTKLEKEIQKLTVNVMEEKFHSGKQRGMSEVLSNEIKIWKEHLRSTERFIRLILLDIFTLATSAYNPRELQEAVQNLYDKYVPRNKIKDLDSEKVLAVQNEGHIEKLHSIIKNIKRNSSVRNKVIGYKTSYSWTCTKRIRDVLQLLKVTQINLEKERERVKTLERALLGMNYVRPSKAKEIYERTCKLHEPQKISPQDQLKMTRQWSMLLNYLIEEIQYLTGIPIMEYVDYNAARLGEGVSSVLIDFLGSTGITVYSAKE